jgi:hypothetical protein
MFQTNPQKREHIRGPRRNRFRFRRRKSGTSRDRSRQIRNLQKILDRGRTRSLARHLGLPHLHAGHKKLFRHLVIILNTVHLLQLFAVVSLFWSSLKKLIGQQTFLVLMNSNF